MTLRRTVMRLATNLCWRLEQWNWTHSRYDEAPRPTPYPTYPTKTWPQCPHCHSGKTTLTWDLHGVADFDMWFCINCQDKFSVTRKPA